METMDPNKLIVRLTAYNTADNTNDDGWEGGQLEMMMMTTRRRRRRRRTWQTGMVTT